MCSVWMSNVLIVVNQNNADRNTLADITAALTDMGSVIAVDDQSHLIEATVPAAELATLSAIDGVSYVRCVFNYLRGEPALLAA